MEESDVGFCPHCGNTVPQELQGCSVSLHHEDGAHNYFMTRCGTCLEAILYRHVDPHDSVPQTSHGRFHLTDYELVWPDPGTMHHAVPEPVRVIYEEAIAVKNRAPNAFANQIRRALESLCADRGAQKQTLAQSLEELASRGEIPPVLAEMTDVLRRLGNIGSHAGQDQVGAEYVDVIDDFFRAIVEYVYIAPHKIREFKARLENVHAPKTEG